MAIDFTKSSKEIVVAHINALHGTAVAAADVNIALTGDNVTPACTLTVTGPTSSPFKGSKDIAFTRLLFSALGTRVSALTGSTVTAGYLIAGVNDIYGINLSLSEVTIDGVSYSSGDNINMSAKSSFTIAAKSSLLWVGSMVIGFRNTQA
jgi:hypothetical protein